MFIVVPMLLVLFYSVTEQTADGYRFTFDHFRRFVDPIYINVLFRSVALALISTVICPCLGIPWLQFWPVRNTAGKRFCIC